MKEEKNAFEKAFVEAIDEGLLMLGESGREVIYFRLRNYYALTKIDVPAHPEIFIECLRKIFGSGSKAIEKAILKSLYRKLGLTLDEKNFDFFECLNEAKKRLNTSRRRQGNVRAAVDSTP